ncbi:YdaS family helix-turn-helix protein [Lichenihabitans psoromatis]|uniref:YdaS family helix-turn-helix protein n=1 Tax=Lichenihabitans psoromatis TaxID=2528642 RepID=UPI0010385506|nr:YdaS family helix-turn-helix protein [Lichenihabitans psoromatis]
MVETRNTIIERAIVEGGGSQAELARRCGCAQQHISKLLNGEVAISAGLAMAITRATDGRVRIADLMPDLVEAVASELGVSVSNALARSEASACLAQ